LIGVVDVGDDDLLAVGDLAGEVDPAEVRFGRGAAGGLDGVADPRAGGNLHHAGLGHLAGDMDDHRRAGGHRARGRSRRAITRAGPMRATHGPTRRGLGAAG